MANHPVMVSNCCAKFPEPQYLPKPPNSREYSPLVTNPFPEKKFRAHGKKKFRFDRIASSYDNYVYVTPAEGKQARRSNAGYKDGAKIYFCNRRSCFLTWKGRSCLLYRLSPRKSRLQSHPAEMRSVPEC